MAQGEDKNSLESTEKLTKLLQNRFEGKEGVSLVGLEKTTDGIFRLALSCGPDSIDEFESTFAGSIKDVSSSFKPIVKSRKYSDNSLMGRNEPSEDRFLTRTLKKYRQAVEKEDRKRWEASVERKLVELKDKWNKEGKSEKEIAAAEVLYRDKLGPTYLDIRRKKRVDEEESLKLYERSHKEYTKNGSYGTAIDILTDFCIKGFKHDVQDPVIKEYFDSYVADTKLLVFISRVYQTLWLSGVCYITTSENDYQPHAEGLSSIPGKPPVHQTKKKLKSAAVLLEKAFREKLGKNFNKGEFDRLMEEVAFRRQIPKGQSSKVPTEFSVIDPSLVLVDDSLMYDDKQRVVLKPEALEEIRNLLERSRSSDAEDKLTDRERELLKLLPSKLKKAAEDNEKYIMDPNTTYAIFYKKLNYQRFAKPPFSRVFDDLDYKEELKKADFATLDGIVNYILLVTVGDKDAPVTDAQTLLDLADALDTPAKAYNLIWNHSIKMEYITPNTVSEILGKDKYEPVNNDIFTGLGVPRALLDGSEIRGEGAKLVLQALNAKIKFMRVLVEDWLYDIYRKVAVSAGFDHYPKIRWSEETISLDSLAVANTNLMNQATNKIASWQTVVEDMGRDPETERSRLEEQLEMEKQGLIIIGSPFQQSAAQPKTQQLSDSDGLSGRPTGQPVQEKSPDTDKNKNNRKPKSTSPSQSDKAHFNEAKDSEEVLASSLENLDEIPE